MENNTDKDAIAEEHALNEAEISILAEINQQAHEAQMTFQAQATGALRLALKTRGLTETWQLSEDKTKFVRG